VLFGSNVGIGTGSPAAKLHITGGTDLSLTSGGYLINGSTSAANMVMDENEIQARNNSGTATLYLNYGGGNVNMCYSGGNVRIGASDAAADGYLLAVDGKVICEELKVQLSDSWPDYVFDNDYTLLSIDELEQSIKTHGHLPGLPSASEVEADGYEIGAMQSNIVEKVEELSLYIIQLKKENDLLKERINVLEQK
jgi:hypothetical protein